MSDSVYTVPGPPQSPATKDFLKSCSSDGVSCTSESASAALQEEKFGL